MLPLGLSARTPVSASASALPEVYVLGDTHVRGELPALTQFLTELAQRPPARLIFLGDVLDYWLDTEACVARHQPLFRQIRDLKAAGWCIEVIIGNREMNASRRFSGAVGWHVRWPYIDIPLHAPLSQKPHNPPNGVEEAASLPQIPRVIRIVHGDRLCDDSGYHLLFAMMRGFWMRYASRLIPEQVQDLIAGAVRRRSEARNHPRHRHQLPFLREAVSLRN